mmetsp:Transcript_80774/g.164494  ORF Transcript_80774/g.164494 Transcript_80774/m.164494 type:complete len:129 (-) Transcript_80774:399-785(-)
MVIQLCVCESWKPEVEAVDDAPGFPGDCQFDVKVSSKPEFILSDDIPSFDGNNKKGQGEDEGVIHTVGFETRQKRVIDAWIAGIVGRRGRSSCNASSSSMAFQTLTPPRAFAVNRERKRSIRCIWLPN